MLTQHRLGYALILVAVLIGVVGCQTATTASNTSTYSDDARIAAEVSAKLAADPTLNARGISVTSTNGVVYLTGTVPSGDRLTRATQLANGVYGVRSVVNNMQVAAAPPAVTTVTAAPASVVVSPPVNIVSGHPPIDAAGTLARYDPQTGVITFQDGRMVRMTTESTVWGPSSAVAFQPGTQVMVRNVHPVGYQPAMAPAPGSWRMGTVSHVDATNGLIYLHDGTVVHVGPSTMLRAGAQTMTLSQLQPGSQVALSVPASTVTVAPGQTTTTTTVYRSAPPRQPVIPMETSEVRIFVVPR